MIEPTDEMKAAFRAAQERRAEELVAEGAPLGGHDILDRGLAAVLALVERDYRIEPRPPWDRDTVHLATAGDGHMHCCGRTPFELPPGDRMTLDPHGATCKGPS